ncbi:MAG: YncE family protein [Candidatus Limnocylindria bacterium]
MDIDRLVVLNTLALPESGGLALDRSLGFLYTTTRTGGFLLVVRSDTLEVVDRVELGAFLGPVAVDQRSHRVFALDIGRGGARGDPRPGRVHVINGNTRQVVGTLPLAAGIASSAVVNSATGRLYVSVVPNAPEESGLVHIFDTDTLREVTRIGVSPGGSLVLDEVSNTLYMTSSVEAPAGRQITFIDGRSGQAATFFPPAVSAHTLGLDVARGHVYLASLAGQLQIGHLRAPNAMPGFFSEGIHDVGAEPAGIAVDPTTKRVFIVSRSGTLTVLLDDFPTAR